MDVLDVTKLRKVNSLASTLNKHGLAVNRMEAAEMAKRFNSTNTGDFECLNNLKINSQQEFEVVDSSNGQQLIVEKQAVPTARESSNYMTREQVESILQKFCDLFSEELNQHNAQIKGMEIKFNYLQEQMTETFKALQEAQANIISQVRQAPQPAPVSQVYTQPHVAPVVQAPVQQAPQYQAPAQEPVHQYSQPTTQRVEPENNVNKPGEPNHKTGGFQSNDVSIEKFFYFGTKK